MSEAVLRDYLKRLEQTFRPGNATEHTYRTNLKNLLETLATGITATNEPKRVTCGAPDFIITRKQTPLGYIETKDIGVSLDKVEHSEQMKRYLNSLGNLVLTDYIEFRWYVAGQQRMTARLAKVSGKGSNSGQKWQADAEGIAQVEKLLQGFIAAQTPTITTPKELATRMAALAQLIRNAITQAFKSEDGGGSLHTQMEGFRQVLLPDLDAEQFADMYAQTICYGLFAARCNAKPDTTFTREHAAFDIPKTNPFLRKMFSHIAGPDLDERIVWAVDGLADATKISVANADGKGSRETHKVQILDPATGTGTFLHSVIDLIYGTFSGNKGMWSSYVSQHLLPRIFGFELLMAPYAVAHMKLGLQLAETGYDFHSNERLGVFLTNTLEEGFEGGKLPFADWIVEEATAAGNVKYDAPVMVVVGNPPYSGHSANKGDWIVDLLHSKDSSYFEVDGQPLGERNPKWLNDDYVKFIRFAQWRIECTGYGILAFITNHGYLDNPTFRGMRQSLMKCFDEIYVLDLHGSSKKKERSPDGTKDENVFDIMPGVAIGIFVKRQGKTTLSSNIPVHHAHLWGQREVYEKIEQTQRLIGGKYPWLTENDITTTKWTLLAPQKPFYLFVPQDIHLREEYERGWKLTEMMSVNVLGFQTHRDHFAIDFEKDKLYSRIDEMRKKQISDQEYTEKYNLSDNPSWKITEARRRIRSDTNWQSYLIRCLYRPFDLRYSYFSDAVMDRPRRELIDHVANRENLCILSSRQQATLGYRHTLVTREVANDCAISTTSREANQVFPLYLYPQPNKNSLFDTNIPSDAPGGRHPNLLPSFITDISNKLNMQFIPDGKGDLEQTFGPEDVFNYMYAVFHAPMYRTRYAEFLKIDFPRLPLTSNAGLFRELCGLGDRLVKLHLLVKFGTGLPMYPEEGNNVVEKVEYLVAGEKPEQGRVYINKTQYFASVPQEVWEFHIGGYQVCHKWLKDRKGRVLSYEDIRHYQRVVAALAETIGLMGRVDEVIEGGGGWPLE